MVVSVFSLITKECGPDVHMALGLRGHSSVRRFACAPHHPTQNTEIGPGCGTVCPSQHGPPVWGPHKPKASKPDPTMVRRHGIRKEPGVAQRGLEQRKVAPGGLAWPRMPQDAPPWLGQPRVVQYGLGWPGGGPGSEALPPAARAALLPLCGAAWGLLWPWAWRMPGEAGQPRLPALRAHQAY